MGVLSKSCSLWQKKVHESVGEQAVAIFSPKSAGQDDESVPIFWKALVEVPQAVASFIQGAKAVAVLPEKAVIALQEIVEKLQIEGDPQAVLDFQEIVIDLKDAGYSPDVTKLSKVVKNEYFAVFLEHRVDVRSFFQDARNQTCDFRPWSQEKGRNREFVMSLLKVAYILLTVSKDPEPAAPFKVVEILEASVKSFTSLRETFKVVEILEASVKSSASPRENLVVIATILEVVEDFEVWKIFLNVVGKYLANPAILRQIVQVETQVEQTLQKSLHDGDIGFFLELLDQIPESDPAVEEDPQSDEPTFA